MCNVKATLKCNKAIPLEPTPDFCATLYLYFEIDTFFFICNPFYMSTKLKKKSNCI